MALYACCLLTLTCLACRTSSFTLTDVVETSFGKVRGLRKTILGQDVDTFLGIPFAKPPTGDLRFQRPESPEPWKDVLNATELPNSCHQQLDDYNNNFEGAIMWNPNTEMSEDCLYLNIWKPTSSHSDQKAVMTWIYGGGFYSGTSTLDLYNGGILAATSDVVVVSVQYRVGILGFAYLGIPGAPGNQGLLDQQLALEWIADNVGNFGGDRGRVTLFGESAGAASVGLHLLSPLSRDYFRYAIMQSSSPISPWAVDSPKVAINRTQSVAKLMGCPLSPPKDALQCLRDVDPQQLSETMWQISDSSCIMTPISSTVDGYFLEQTPLEYVSKGSFKRTSILLGANLDEGFYFLFYVIPQIFDLKMKNKTLTFDEFQDSIVAVTHDESFLLTEVLAFEYGVPYNFKNKTKFRDSIDDLLGDLAFICPVVNFASAYAEAGQDVFMYHFLHHTSGSPWPSWTGAMHGYEIDHVFGLPLDSTMNYTEPEKQLSERMVRYWTNFAKTG